MLHTYFLASFLLCVLPAHFPVYQTILDLPAISILSCYVPLCHITDTFLFCTDFLTCTFHSILLLLMTPFHYTTYVTAASGTVQTRVCKSKLSLSRLREQ